MAAEVERIGDATLYRGDALEILPTLAKGKVDAVIADPPYAVDFAAWDGALVDFRWLEMARQLAPSVLVGVRNMFAWPAPSWVGSYSYPLGLKVAAGGKLNAWEPVLIYGANCLPLDSRQFPPVPSEHVEGHPCPKPLAPFRWLVGAAAAPGGIILDPFMGSGTTGVACAKMGRRFIGIEVDEKYFSIACRRIRDTYAQGDLFLPAPKADQWGLDLGIVDGRRGRR